MRVNAESSSEWMRTFASSQETTEQRGSAIRGDSEGMVIDGLLLLLLFVDTASRRDVRHYEGGARAEHPRSLSCNHLADRINAWSCPAAALLLPAAACCRRESKNATSEAPSINHLPAPTTVGFGCCSFGCCWRPRIFVRGCETRAVSPPQGSAAAWNACAAPRRSRAKLRGC
ncbi:hypothetical protein L1887_50188 [Cichorium endivia]|nr:hypothetical protein L1887_50188 [Cichorium endivia]